MSKKADIPDKGKTERQWSIRFPLDLHERIAREAQEQNRSFNAQVIWILRDYFKRCAREQP
jgi:predicted HicB family RNase H-like nuclease